ncbi:MULTISPECIES: hypothetical protein [unclassified Nonomuraea]|uniref:hypothetical protein n=1 Tax=unclassified Nonomuraea TaxID=2593643 RepID=UPI0033FC9902
MVGKEDGGSESAPYLTCFDDVSWREQELPVDIRSLRRSTFNVATSGANDA